MTISIMNESCSDFTAALAAKKSVPGGGAVAAFAGAMAAALCTMVGAFTVGKPRYAAHEDEVLDLMQRADDLRQRFLSLAQEDGEAFQPLAKAYGLPKDDPKRTEALEAGALEALKPPLVMMECTVELIGLLESMDQYGSALLRSDVGCGATIAVAALEAAAINVSVNCGDIHDPQKKARIIAKADSLLEAKSRALLLAETISADLRNAR